MTCREKPSPSFQFSQVFFQTSTVKWHKFTKYSGQTTCRCLFFFFKMPRQITSLPCHLQHRARHRAAKSAKAPEPCVSWKGKRQAENGAKPSHLQAEEPWYYCWRNSALGKRPSTDGSIRARSRLGCGWVAGPLLSRATGERVPASTRWQCCRRESGGGGSGSRVSPPPRCPCGLVGRRGKFCSGSGPDPPQPSPGMGLSNNLSFRGSPGHACFPSWSRNCLFFPPVSVQREAPSLQGSSPTSFTRDVAKVLMCEAGLRIPPGGKRGAEAPRRDLRDRRGCLIPLLPLEHGRLEQHFWAASSPGSLQQVLGPGKISWGGFAACVRASSSLQSKRTAEGGQGPAAVLPRCSKGERWQATRGTWGGVAGQKSQFK